jgi:putative tryptophan/tyrosine transport system substrate-binding protein
VKRRDLGGWIAGALIGWPLLAGAQGAAKRYRIAFLALTPSDDVAWTRVILDRLRELGYREGENIEIAYRSAEGHSERMPQLASELVGLRPDVVIAGFGTVAAKAAKTATATIPIVFTTVGDPVGAGVVESLPRPGGNVTGLTDQAKDIGGKRLELLQEATAGKTSFAVLMNPETPYSALATAEIQGAAKSRMIAIRVLEARNFDEVSRRLGEIGNSDVAGLVVLGDPLTMNLRSEIADLAIERRLAAIFQFRESIEAGGPMSYGPDRRQMNRRAAEYVDKLLRGAKPADLPVEQPTKFELVINLKTARAISLDLPPSLLARADEIIE